MALTSSRASLMECGIFMEAALNAGGVAQSVSKSSSSLLHMPNVASVAKKGVSAGQASFSSRMAFFAGSPNDHLAKHSLRTRPSRRQPVRALPENGEVGGLGDMGEPFFENDDNYVPATVVEAVEARSGVDGFMIRMVDGRYMRCAHNNPEGRLPEYPPQPVIVLRMDDGSNLLMPIIVVELPATMLLEAVRNIPMQRPTVYQVVRDMVEIMGYEVKLVRVTHRVQEAYFARIYLSKVGGTQEQTISLDLRPSDAINLAARCKVPIQVNKRLARSDSVRILRDASLPLSRSHNRGPAINPELDRPHEGDDNLASEEFRLIRLMAAAAQEERYTDAAKLRDEINSLRGKRQAQRKQEGA